MVAIVVTIKKPAELLGTLKNGAKILLNCARVMFAPNKSLTSFESVFGPSLTVITPRFIMTSSRLLLILSQVYQSSNQSPISHLLLKMYSRENKWRAPWKNRICSTTMKLRKSLVKPVTWQRTCNYIDVRFFRPRSLCTTHLVLFTEPPPIYASCMTISGGTTE